MMSDYKFGNLNQYKIGSIFKSRKALSESGIHAPTMAGIWGRQNECACSIVMSGGYEDDIDELDYILYTGHGGQDIPGGKQIKDQEFIKGNQALKLSFENKLPIRVTRGSKIKNGPQDGYRYDGLYYINHIERVVGKSGYFVCRFHLQSELSIESLESDLESSLKQNYERTTRTKSSTDKVDRNPKLSEDIKELYEYSCQVCDKKLEKPNGAIAVGAHIRGLGRPHDGPDDKSNLICLCPNHHAQFDAFAFYVDAATLEIIGLNDFTGKQLTVSKKHKINSDFFSYHAQLYNKAQSIS
jgi:putative restriction endonuclease